MGILDAVLHAFHFMFPAVFLALLMPLLSQIFKQNKPLARMYIAQSAINFIACLLVLVAGLLLSGRDGKMLTYLAMVLASAGVQWVLSGGWRR
jgi:hypothetical protein